ncbi:MAG TPA: 3,4-dihydroxy-2-butanone-4-phosphate synthase [Thermoplasmata archaeon]|nr:3,4-dihydroxy-2-butanone-4-phosphate synthase [Thermoplasmata archaeon]
MLAVRSQPIRPRAVPVAVEEAGAALARGEPVLLFDAPDREGETDLVILSELATPELIRLLRRDAGGVLFTAISAELREAIGLPFQSEMLEIAEERFPTLRGLRKENLRYDKRSSFGVSVNHRSTFTGVTDNDRARTVRAMGELARAAPLLDRSALRLRFEGEFSSPGHVPLLYAAPGLLAERKGHTELTVSLARMTGLSECVTGCEMLGDSGGARSPEAAARYASEHGWRFLDGESLREAWVRWSE